MRTIVVMVLSILACSSIVIGQENITEISVNSTGMEVNDDGYCTLIEAIISANSHSPSGSENGECPAGADTTIIILEGGETYLLEQSYSITAQGNNGLPVIDSKLVIRSNNNDRAAIVRSPTANTFRMFEIAEEASLELQNISIENGDSEIGGAIYNDGNLLLRNVTLTSNHAVEAGGAIYNNGSLDASEVELKENTTYLTLDPIEQINYAQETVTSQAGAGIFNNRDAITVIRDSQFIENKAQAVGGGIYNYVDSSLVSLHNVLISDNEAYLRGGGICSWGTVFIESSTLHSNSSLFSGGGIFSQGILSINNSLIDGNLTEGYGGGIHNTGTLILNSTIITNNSGLDGGGILNVDTLYVDRYSDITGNEAENIGPNVYNP